MIPNNRPYLIGETAFHHMGEIDFLKELIYHAHKLGLDAIKFHLLLDVHDYMVENHEVVETIEKWCFREEEWKDIIKHASSKNLDLVLLCNDVKSIKWVNNANLEVRAIEIHATGINDVFLLEEASKFNGTVILGTGGSTMDEIQYAVDFLKANSQNDIFLMHGFQNYPTSPTDVKLSRMKIMQEIFDLPVGYADHTDPNDPYNETLSVFAAAQGFNVLEKHFTHVFGNERIDSHAAVSLDQLSEIKNLLKIAYNAFGEEPLKMSRAEMKYGDVGPMKKAIVARKDISIGHVLTKEDIAFKRTNCSSPIKQREVYNFIGAKSKENIKKDTILTYGNIQFSFSAGDIEQFLTKGNK